MTTSPSAGLRVSLAAAGISGRVQRGVPARVAMQILGHSQISLTLRTYSHVVPELAEDAAERMSQALWGSPQ